MFRDGGNAVDAAVAANAVLAVVYPHMSSIGGDLMALVWPAGAARPVGLEGAGRSGALASIDAVRSEGFTEMPERGATTVTVPGTPVAWGRLIEEHGRLALGHLLAPAASIADAGFTVTGNLALALQREAGWLMREPEARKLLPPLKAGMTMRNRDLARTLTEVGSRGFLSFYRGRIAAAIVGAVAERGGFLTVPDLYGGVRPKWVDPLELDYRDTTVFELPPPAQGVVALGMLARLARLPPELGPGAEFVRHLARVSGDVYALRDRYLGDPDFAPVPLAPFLDLAVEPLSDATAVPDGGTVCVCAADAEGTVAVLVQSLAGTFGSGIVAEGTGVLLNNRGSYFSLEPSSPNRLEPRKRPFQTLIPALAARAGAPWAAFGSMGGDAQPQVHVQLLRNLVDHRLDAADAVAAPRARVKPRGGEITVEADYPGVRELMQWPNVRLAPPRSGYLGHAQAVVVERGGWAGGSDPRSDGAVIEV